jgi:predicted RNA polymerase sigma factor
LRFGDPHGSHCITRRLRTLGEIADLALALAAVLAVVYLIFNEGYGGRNELAAEALRLGRSLAELMPDEPEAAAVPMSYRRRSRRRRPRCGVH